MNWNYLNRIWNDRRSASSAIGIILVTGLVVILSAVGIAAFYGFADDVGESEEIASADQCGLFEFEAENVDNFAEQRENVYDVPCVMWFDASRLEYDDGETVNEWPDQSANQFVGIAEGDPEFQSNVDGVSSVVFESADDERFLTNVDPQDLGLDGNSEKAYTLVIRDRTGGDRGGFIAMGQPGTTGAEFSFTSLSENNYRVQNWGRVADIDLGVDGSYENWIVVTVTFDGDETTVYANGVEYGDNSYTLDTAQTGQIKLGEWDGNNLDGEIAEVIVFDHHLDEGERTEVECTIDEKYDGAVSVRGC